MTKKKQGASPQKPMLPIRPYKLGGTVTSVPVRTVKSGILPGIEWSDAVVAFLDILGFASKSSEEDIRTSLADFLGPLAIAASQYPSARFNIFSDCAFVAVPKKNAKDLLSILRFGFTQWASDGILVRGGVASGNYQETHTIAEGIGKGNFRSSLFAGSAVNMAVRLEGSGPGALLFTTKECAEFYSGRFKEPIFNLDGHLILSWSDDESVLYWFVGISFLRLLAMLSTSDDVHNNPISTKLYNNIRYALQGTDSLLPWLVMLAVLESTIVSPIVRDRAIKALGINDPDDFELFKVAIREWKKDPTRIFLLKYLAEMDSSITFTA